MEIIRYKDKHGTINYGWVKGDNFGIITGSIFGEYERAEADTLIDSVELLPPVTPSKIICVGRNYADHAEEHLVELPDSPMLFMKPPSSIITDGHEIKLPPQSKHVEHEAELGIVIGAEAKWLHPETAKECIFGYIIVNDVTARDLQKRDGQWTRAKGFDTFCPVGSSIFTEFDPADAIITCHVNQELRQVASTRDMVFSISQLLVFISSVMTLNPGDLILTGTPSGVGVINDGDDVRVSIEGLGEMNNPVIDYTHNKE